MGRNGNVHHRSHRGKGPGTQGRISRDNAGKGHLPAGACDNLQRPVVIGKSKTAGGFWSGA